MPAKWIDFKTLRAHLIFSDVLEHFGFEVHGRGQQIKILCPFHEDHKPSCGVNLTKNIYNCFSCGEGGNALDFFAHMEGLDPDNSAELRKAALQAADVFGIDAALAKSKRVKIKPKTNTPRDAKNAPSKGRINPDREKPAPQPKSADKGQNSRPVAPDANAPNKPVHKPLRFELKLDAEHPFIAEKTKQVPGFQPELISEFGIGYCDKGIMKERICFPIHNVGGKLIAYAGRWASDDLPEDVMRYKLPTGFEKSKVLYNLHRVIEMRKAHPDLDTVVIVEGFWSVMRLHGLGIPTVSTFGSSVSTEQVERLVQNGFKKAVLIFDGDEGGRSGSEQALPLLAARLFTRCIHLPEGIKPDVMDEQIVSALPRYY